MAAYLAAFCAGAGRHKVFLSADVIHEHPEDKVQTIKTQTATILNTVQHFVALIVQINFMLE